MSPGAIIGTRATKDAVRASHRYYSGDGMCTYYIQVCFGVQKEKEEEAKAKELLEQERKHKEDIKRKHEEAIACLSQRKEEIENRRKEMERELEQNKDLLNEAQKRMDKAVKEKNNIAMSTGHKLNQVALQEYQNLQKRLSHLTKDKDLITQKFQVATKTSMSSSCECSHHRYVSGEKWPLSSNVQSESPRPRIKYAIRYSLIIFLGKVRNQRL